SFKVGSRTFSAKVVTISMLHPKVSLDVALAGDSIGKVEDLSSLAKRNQAVVAINGTFFDAYTKSSYKTPYGYLVSHG
ncbi:copper amine oxidase, partial [Paenibacillus sp. EKM208P]